MQALFKITKITFLSALRSYLILSLFIILLLCSVFLPSIITGDGTPASHIRLSIQYTLTITTLVLIASTIFFSCFTMTSDMDYYQIHLVTVKPVHRITVWLGKFLGVFFIHALLLCFTYLLFYLVLFHDIKNSSYPNKDVAKIKNEILTGQSPIYSDTSNIVKVYFEKLKKAEKESKSLGKKLTSYDLQNLKSKVYNQTLAQGGQVEPLNNKVFLFKGIDPSKNLILKYKVYVGSIDMIARQNKPEAPGYWEIKNPLNNEFTTLSNTPKNIISNIFNQVQLPNGYVGKDGNIALRFNNKSKSESVFFQINESPLILVKESGFLMNYIRSFTASILCLAFVAGLGCAFGSVFSFPIAIFCIISYLTVGSISNFILTSDSLIETKFYKKALDIIVPLQKFDTENYISSGNYISNMFIWKLIFELIIIRELPLIILCIYLYSKRELGLINKK